MTPINLVGSIVQLTTARDLIDQQISGLQHMVGTSRQFKRRSTASKTTSRRIRQRAVSTAINTKSTIPSRRRRMSPEARKRLSLLAKQRWAKSRAQGSSTLVKTGKTLRMPARRAA